MALSSSEAELNTLSKAIKQALYMCKFLQLLEINYDQPIPLANDNQSAIMLAMQSMLVFQARIKHYDIKLYHLHDSTVNGLVSMHYCPIEAMPADILTKALPHPRLKELKELLGLHMSRTYGD